MNNVLKVLCLVIIVMISQFVPMIDYNEMAYIPHGYWLYSSSWLENDWSLAYSTLHLYPFGYLSGFFVQQFGFIPTIFVGRIVSYIFFSYSFLKLTKAFELDFSFTVACLTVFLLYFSEGMYAGEWIVGGLETKVFAYSLVLLSIAAILRDTVGSSFLYAGVALSLHPLVGGYHILCLANVLLYKVFRHQMSFKTILKKSYLFLIGGFWGIAGILIHLFEQNDVELSRQAWDILVQVRVPFHNLPKLYSQALFFPMLFSIFNGVMLFFSKKLQVRELSVYILTTVFISGLGILIYLFGDQTLLRFYFFRFGDSMQPLLTLAVLSTVISSLWSSLSKKVGQKKIVENMLVTATLAVVLSLFLVKNSANLRSLRDNSFTSEEISKASSMDFELMKWIKKETNKNAVFIAPVSMETFFMDAQRSLFVSWKLAPYEVERIVEWYRRILLLNKGEDLFAKNIDPKRELEKNYSRLTENEILKIQRLYPEITHIISPSTNELAFDEAYRTERFILYRL
ncbi:MAG: DUF6798 domain-containing protein [Cyclobacteriaceae bacterium]